MNKHSVRAAVIVSLALTHNVAQVRADSTIQLTASGETVTLRTKMKPGITRGAGSAIVNSPYLKTLLVETTGELVSTQDSTVYLRVGPTSQANTQTGSGFPRRGTIVAVPYADVFSIKLTGKENRKWVLPLLLFEVAPAFVLSLTAMSMEGNSVGNGLVVMIATSIPTLLNWVLFESGSRRNERPDTAIHHRLDQTKLEVGWYIEVWRKEGGKSVKRKGYVRDVDEDSFTISRKFETRGFVRRIAYEDVLKVRYVVSDSFEFGTLRKYARFPQGLTAGQMDQLLKSHGQETPGTI